MALGFKAFLQHKLHFTLRMRLELWILLPGIFLSLLTTYLAFHKVRLDLSSDFSLSVAQLQSVDTWAGYYAILALSLGLLATLGFYGAVKFYLYKVSHQLRDINSDLHENLDNSWVQILSLQTFIERSQVCSRQQSELVQQVQVTMQRMFELTQTQTNNMQSEGQRVASEVQKTQALQQQVCSHLAQMNHWNEFLSEIVRSCENDFMIPQYQSASNDLNSIYIQLDEFRKSLFQAKTLATHTLGQAQLSSFSGGDLVAFIEKIGFMVNAHEKAFAALNQCIEGRYGQEKEFVENIERWAVKTRQTLVDKMKACQRELVQQQTLLEQAQKSIDIEWIQKWSELSMRLDVENPLPGIHQVEANMQQLTITQAEQQETEQQMLESLRLLKEHTEIILRDHQALELLADGNTALHADRKRAGNFDVI